MNHDTEDRASERQGEGHASSPLSSQRISSEFHGDRSPLQADVLSRIRTSSTFDSDTNHHDELDMLPQIQASSTFDSENTHEELNELEEVHSVDPKTTPQHIRDETENLLSTLYISSFSFLGCVLRRFVARLLGSDCDFQDTEMAIADFLTPVSRHICVTASGQTSQHGGALFLDAPANMLGSFLLGMMCYKCASEQPLCWLQKDHRLQRHKPFHTALSVGFCGSLSTCKYPRLL